MIIETFNGQQYIKKNNNSKYIELNTRCWEKDHNKDLWHCYLYNDYLPALCGAKPLPGSPMATSKIEECFGEVCEECKKYYEKVIKE